MTRFLPPTGHPCEATFAPAKVRLSQKLRDGLPAFGIPFVSELFRRERSNLLFCLLPPPSFVRGEVEGGFSKESLPSEKLSLERGKKGGGGRERRTTGRETARVHGLQGHGSGIGFGLGKDFGRMGVTCNQPLLILTS